MIVKPLYTFIRYHNQYIITFTDNNAFNNAIMHPIIIGAHMFSYIDGFHIFINKDMKTLTLYINTIYNCIESINDLHLQKEGNTLFDINQSDNILCDYMINFIICTNQNLNVSNINDDADTDANADDADTNANADDAEYDTDDAEDDTDDAEDDTNANADDADDTDNDTDTDDFYRIYNGAYLHNLDIFYKTSL